MPAAKNTTVRYHIINHCLTRKNKKYWSLEELIQTLVDKDISINSRTLRYDIEAMRFDKRLGYEGPIAYCKVNRGYGILIQTIPSRPFTLRGNNFNHLTLSSTAFTNIKTFE